MLRLKPVRRSLFGGAVVWALCVALGLSALAATAAAAPQDLDLVSRANGPGGPKGNSFSRPTVASSVSADGRYVTFASEASNLDPDDPDSTRDVFVRDLTAGTTTLVSRATTADGAKGDNSSLEPAISADGRYVTFRSSAANLHPDDPDSTNDVFVRDLTANTTTLVSRATGATGAKGNSGSAEPAISADGRYITFRSNASNLDPDDPDTINDVFVRDLTANTTTLVSRATGVIGAKGDNSSIEPAISADGRYVTFTSSASDLDPADTNTFNDVFVRDLQAGTTTLVSRATTATGDNGNDSSNEPAISADGRYVTFRSDASNLDPDDPDTINDVFVRDLTAATTTLVSRATGATGDKGNSTSLEPAISADGRYVTFSSSASNLHPADTDTINDVFVRDLTAATTTLVSRATGATGAKGNNGSAEPAISADGRYVTFSSSASNLHPADTDTARDVFLRDTAYDTDGDGVLDGDDDCPGTTSGTTVAADGCPDPDSDGISTNAGDNCPNAANADQVNTDGDAQGDACDADDDNDGVADGVDECPGTPSGTIVRPDGCANNTPPVAVMDSYTAVGGAPLTVPVLTGVLANDSDADGDALTAERVAGPSAGTLTLNPNGSFTYTPGENTVGSDSFTYRAFDGTAYSNTVTVLISVQAGCEGRRATLVGTPGRDVLKGTGGNDVIVALGGNDTVDSGSGNDIICAGSGDDLVEHGSGNDRLYGGTGHDRLAAGSDDDLLYGGAGNDVLDGGSDDDRLFGEDGADRLYGGGYDDHLDGGAGAPDLCDGQGGSDTATTSCEQRVDVP